MLKVLAILTLVVAMLVPATAAFAERDMEGADKDHQVTADVTQAEPIAIGSVAGADQNAPVQDYRENSGSK